MSGIFLNGYVSFFALALLSASCSKSDFNGNPPSRNSQNKNSADGKSQPNGEGSPQEGSGNPSTSAVTTGTKTTASGSTSGPTSGSTPGPTSGSTPGPTSGSTPGPTSGSTPGPTSGSTPGPITVPPDIKNCESRTLTTRTFTLNFPATKGQCIWDIGDARGVMMARKEQSLRLPVEANWVVCSMTLSSNKSDFYYDDFFMLNLNDRVLMGSTGLVDMFSKDSLGLPIYNWSQLQRRGLEGSNTCVMGATACSLVQSQRPGNLRFELNGEANLKLMTHVFNENRYDFQVVTTGDGEHSIDCAQNGLPLNVTIKYYSK